MSNALFLFISLSFKSLRALKRVFIKVFDQIVIIAILKGNGIKRGRNVRFNGVPFIDVNKRGKCVIGDRCSFNSRIFYNPIGRNQKCCIVVGKDAVLSIGRNSGISSSAIICYDSISIGNNVKIGGNTVIYDSDFHALDFIKRRSALTDIPQTKAVIIADDVFIGAHVTILKGVNIGARSIIAAGSIVTKDIPPDEIWGGNPAKKIGSTVSLS